VVGQLRHTPAELAAIHAQPGGTLETVADFSCVASVVAPAAHSPIAAFDHMGRTFSRNSTAFIVKDDTLFDWIKREQRALRLALAPRTL